MEPILRLGLRTVRLAHGDITEQDVDAIVNPANEQLFLGGGVAGAIAAKGGPEIQTECDRLAPIAVGEAVMTGGGKLKARHVIHAVGPRGGQQGAEHLLASAVYNALAVANRNGLKTLALPAISTGIFGYPMADCARITVPTVVEALRAQMQSLMEVRVVLFDWQGYRMFGDELAKFVWPTPPVTPEPAEAVEDEAAAEVEGGDA